MKSVSVERRAARDGSVSVSVPAPKLVALPWLLLYRRQIDAAFEGAKKTRHGMPTSSAILDRWWIEENRPEKDGSVEWKRSFAGACEMLELDVDAERVRLLAAIDAAWAQDALEWIVRPNVYRQRAAVLSLAGVVTTIARQHVLPMVHDADYEHVAGVEHPDPKTQMRLPEAA